MHSLLTILRCSNAVYDIIEQEAGNSINLYHKIVPGHILKVIILLQTLKNSVAYDLITVSFLLVLFSKTHDILP